MLTAEQKDKITKAVAHFCAIANVRVPEVTFSDSLGRSAGAYYPTKDLIHYNVNIAYHHFDVFLIDTVPHEVAHHVDFVRHGNKVRRHPSGRRDMHGRFFKAIVAEIGAVTSTKHSYSLI
jgi:predicted SprT family Zn-dependent metalloprotease